MTNPNSGPDIRQALQATPFAHMGDAALDSICRVARVEHFKVATLLSAAGQQPAYLRMVVAGHMDVVARNASGGEFVVGHITPGGWATWLSCFMENPPDNDFYSSAAACFVAIPVAEVRAFCVRHPEIYPLIIRQIGRRMRLLTEWTGQSVLADPLQRLAKLLHLLAREQRQVQGDATLHVTQARLASLARCSRQTANEMLTVLEKKGLLVKTYGRIEIADLARLAEFAEAGGG